MNDTPLRNKCVVSIIKSMDLYDYKLVSFLSYLNIQRQIQDLKLERAPVLGKGSGVALRPQVGPGHSPDGSPEGEAPGSS